MPHLSQKPTRLFLNVRFPDVYPYVFDERGFAKNTVGVYELNDLLEFNCVSVIGPPWLGKTTFAHSLKLYLTAEGHTVHFDQLETHTTGQVYEVPRHEKQRTKAGKALYWIIDSIDEGENIQRNICEQIIRALSACSTSQRDQMRVVFLSREAERPRALDKLASLYVEEFVEVRLLPLTCAEASDMLPRSSFPRIMELISSCKLSTWAGYPIVLKELERLPEDSRTDAVHLWDRILRRLLLEFNTDRIDRSQSLSVENQFVTAKWLAAVVLLGGIDEIADSPEHGVVLEELFPHNPASLGMFDKGAARAVLRSAYFQRTPTGRRFVRRNVIEWLSASYLRDFDLHRIRPILCDEKGRPRPDLRGVVALLRTLSLKEDVSQWVDSLTDGAPILSDVLPFDLDEALSYLDRIEASAKRTVGYVRLPQAGEEVWKNFRIRGFGQELANRLADTNRKHQIRCLLLDIAEEVSAREVVPVAKSLLQSQTENPMLRKSAAYFLTKFASPESLDRLATFVKRWKTKSETLRSAKSVLITAFLRNDLWTVAEAVAQMPPVSESVVDATHMIRSDIVDRMRISDAREIIRGRLPHNLGISENSRTKHLDYDYNPYYRALQLILSDSATSDDDLCLLIPKILAIDSYLVLRSLREPVMVAYSKRKIPRRELYSTVKSLPEAETENWIPIARWSLTPDDVDWLIASKGLFGSDLDDLASLLFELSFREGCPAREKARIRCYLKQQHSETFERMRNNRRRSHQREARWRKREREQKVEQLKIENLVPEILESKDRGLEEKVLSLAWICFAEERSRPTNVAGEWADLESTVRNDVLNLCIRALDELNSTPIPDGNRFPGAIIRESQLFRGVLRYSGDDFVLTADLIRKWLPSVVVLYSDDQSQTIDTCFQVDGRASQQVFIEALERDMRSGSEHLNSIANLDPSHWGEGLIEATARSIQQLTYSMTSRGRALEILALRDKSESVRIATEIVGGEWNWDSPLFAAGVNVLIALEAESIWPLIREEIGKDGAVVLGRLNGLTGHGLRVQANLSDWSASMLLELAYSLHTYFPYREDEALDGWVDQTMELRRLRDQTSRVLFERGSREDMNALTQLARRYPKVQEWLSYVEANESLGHLMRSDIRGGQGAIPLPQLIKALENIDYRVVKSPDDLLEVLREQLDQIAHSAPRHYSLLYDSKSGGRKSEDALQAYVACRLADRLPDKVLDRETKVEFENRPDILVRAVSATSGLGASNFVTAVIEIKWSDNRELATSLGRQLGNKYLRNSGLTHGLYAVGWSGKVAWRGTRNKLASRSQSCVLDALKVQAASYARKYPEIRIEPFILDLAAAGNVQG